MSLTSEVVARSHAAFERAEVPQQDELLAAHARNNLDALELGAALAGKHWTAVPLGDLFYHRESIIQLSAIGWRAYIAAFLIAALAGDNHSPDIGEHTLSALHPWLDHHHALMQERVAILNDEQRCSIAAWLRYVTGYARSAPPALDYWLALEGGARCR